MSKNKPPTRQPNDDAYAYYAKKTTDEREKAAKELLGAMKQDPNIISKSGMSEFMKKAYSKEVNEQEKFAKSMDKWPLNTNRTAAEHIQAQQKAFEKMKKMQEASGAKQLSDEELAEAFKALGPAQENAKAQVLHKLEKRTTELEKALKKAGTRDPLLVATNEVLADENKRLTAEVERLLDEKADIRRRLDEAHDRLYRTIDILQERALEREKSEDHTGPQEAQEEAQEARGSHGGAEQAPGGCEHDAEGGQREAAQEGEGARGENSRSLTVVGGTRS